MNKSMLTRGLSRLFGAVALILGHLLASAPLSLAQAQTFPSRSIQFLVPYTPGAGGDTVARVLAEKLAGALGQSVVVENRGGANGLIGTVAGAKAPADGYTWTLGADPAFTINPLLRKVPYDPLRDFVPVVQLTRLPLLLVVNPSLPIHSVQDLVAYVKKNPGKMNVAMLGTGSNAHLAAELLKSLAGLETVAVPYKGQAEALTGVMGGHSHIAFSSIGSVQGFIKSGRLRAIAITSDKRFGELPDIPTVAEAGFPGYEVFAWHGIMVPAGTPRETVLRINQEVNKVLAAPDVAGRLSSMGLFPVGGPPELLEQLLKRDTDKWSKLIHDIGIKAD